MQGPSRKPSFGRWRGSTSSSLRGGSSDGSNNALESIAELLTSQSSVDVPSAQIEDVVRSIGEIGHSVSISELAQKSTLSTDELTQTLVEAGKLGMIGFDESEDGSILVFPAS